MHIQVKASAGTRTHARTHTKQSKASRCLLQGHTFLVKPGHLCTKQVRCAGAMQTPGAGQGARRRTDCASHCRCGHAVVPQLPLVADETQPVCFAPQYKTRYPFYRWVGWWAGVFMMFFSSCSGIRTGVLQFCLGL